MSEEQLTRTFTAMRRKFLHIATLFLPQKDDAEDALQDAFVKLWSRRDNINSDKEAEALTTTTVKNICIDKLRKQKIDTVPIDEEHDDSPEENNEERETLLQEVEAIINKELTPQQQKNNICTGVRWKKHRRDCIRPQYAARSSKDATVESKKQD